LNCEDWWGG